MKDTLDVVTMSRDDAEGYVPTGLHEICISIRSVGSSQPRLSDAFQEVLYLEFDDCEERDEPRFRSLSHLQAEMVFELLSTNLEADRLVVHCEAGISRSVSLASAIVDVMNIRAPNRTVYTRALEALHPHRMHLGWDLREKKVAGPRSLRLG